MAETKPYFVTELAGPYVAGRKVVAAERPDANPQRPLQLTASQAEHLLRTGEIVAQRTVEKPAPAEKMAEAKRGRVKPDGE